MFENQAFVGNAGGIARSLERVLWTFWNDRIGLSVQTKII